MSGVKRSVVIYACAFAVAGATPFLLLPVLTRHLSPAQFGEVTAFLMLSALLANVGALGTPGLMSVRVAKTSVSELKGLIGACVISVVAAHLLIAACLAFAPAAWVAALPVSRSVAQLAVVASFATAATLIILVYFQSAERPMLYLLLRVVQGSGEILLCVLALQLIGADPSARTWTYTCALYLSLGCGLVVLVRSRSVSLKLEAGHFQLIWRVAIPLLPHIIAGTLLGYLDRFILSVTMGAEPLGVYMAAMQIAMMMLIVIEPLHRALAPWLFRQLASSNGMPPLDIVRRTYWLFASLALTALVIAAGGYFIASEVLDARYAAARGLVGWVVLGYLFNGMYYGIVGYIMFAERTAVLSTITIAIVALSTPITYLLTTTAGAKGAALAFAFNNLMLFLVTWRVAAKVHPMPWRLRNH